MRRFVLGAGYTWSIGAVIALVVLIIALVLAIMGSLPWPVAGLIMGLAVARLL